MTLQELTPQQLAEGIHKILTAKASETIQLIDPDKPEVIDSNSFTFTLAELLHETARRYT